MIVYNITGGSRNERIVNSYLWNSIHMRRAGSCAVWSGMWLALNATMNKLLQGTRLSRLETPPRIKEGLLEIRKIRDLAPLSKESRSYFDVALDDFTLLLQRMAIRARPSLPLPLPERGYQTNVVPRDLNPLCVFFKTSRKPWAFDCR